MTTGFRAAVSPAAFRNQDLLYAFDVGGDDVGFRVAEK